MHQALRHVPALILAGWIPLVVGCGNDDTGASVTCARGEVLVNGACVADSGRPGRPTRPTDPGHGEDVGQTADAGASDAEETDDAGGSGDVDPTAPDTALTDIDLNPPSPDIPPIDSCDGPGEVPTTVRGLVRIPSGELPLPDVNVYFAEFNEVREQASGAECVPCGNQLTGRPIVETTTALDGTFELVNAPVGEDLLLVVEIGKWRRTTLVPRVERCAVTNIDPELTRLPRNQSEGTLPRFAVTTGGCDALECLLRKIGISDEEFTPEGGGGAVTLYAGTHGTRRYAPSLNGGASFPDASSWWRNVSNLMDYDIILHSCECSEAQSGKPDAAVQAMAEYADRGGRLFLSHYHYTWLRRGPAPFQAVATWNTRESAMRSPSTTTIDTSFPKGEQLSNWLFTNGITSVRSTFQLREARASVTTLNDSLATRWAHTPATCDPFVQSTFPALCPPANPEQPVYMSFNAPVYNPPEDQCGRVVHSDIHVSGGDRSSSGTRENSGPEVRFPNGCTTSGLTEQEAVLVFMLFDLSRCIVPDKR